MDIKEFFKINNKAAIAFSGGVDSAYLLAEAAGCGADVRAYYVKTVFQPEFEREDARRLAGGVSLTEISLDILSDERIASNPENRCYYCKQHIMRAIIEAAAADGYHMVCDGTNASDDISDRPGYRALTELGVRSPLRECGLTKEAIRTRARELGLDVWNKPAYACLATRILQGETVTREKLETTERAEKLLFDMGFRDFRVRMRNGEAFVQMSETELDEAAAREAEIISALTGLYDSVTVWHGRRQI